MAERPTKFFPTADAFFKGTRLSPSDLAPGRQVAIDGGVLKELLRAALRSYGFDEEAYLESNPDVRYAYEQQDIRDLNEHYAQSGFIEGRTAVPASFDESRYLNSYPDVALAIKNKDVPSAKAHYVSSGLQEWRCPSEDVEPELQSWYRVLVG